jgi:hypothetical protein
MTSFPALPLDGEKKNRYENSKATIGKLVLIGL